MKRTVKNALLRYALTLSAGAAMVWLVLDLHGFAEKTTAADRYLVLSNAFTIPGTVLLMSGILTLISGTGALDGLTYALNWLKLTLLPFGKQPRYMDHVERRKNRPKFRGGFLLICGALFLAVAVFFLVRFYEYYPPKH